MADNEEDQDLVDYDEEEEEENVVAEKSTESDSKEVKKWVKWTKSVGRWRPKAAASGLVGKNASRGQVNFCSGIERRRRKLRN